MLFQISLEEIKRIVIRYQPYFLSTANLSRGDSSPTLFKS